MDSELGGLQSDYAMSGQRYGRRPGGETSTAPPELEVVIEDPRGSFLKRGSTGQVDFVSPLPCPFNYGSVPKYPGLEGDLLPDRETMRGQDHRLRSDWR